MDGAPPLEILPKLEEIVCPVGRLANCDFAFSLIVNTRQAAGRLVCLARLNTVTRPSDGHSPQVRGPIPSILDPFPLTFYDTKPPVLPKDILVGGFLSHTFSPKDAHDLFTRMLETSDFLRDYRVSYRNGGWYAMQDASHVRRSLALAAVPAQYSQVALDFSVKSTPGTAVPKEQSHPWHPLNFDIVDFGRDTGSEDPEATLQLPIFFINQNGAVGFGLTDILQGCGGDLCNRAGKVPVGRQTTYICIDVSSHTVIIASNILIYVIATRPLTLLIVAGV